MEKGATSITSVKVGIISMQDPPSYIYFRNRWRHAVRSFSDANDIIFHYVHRIIEIRHGETNLRPRFLIPNLFLACCLNDVYFSAILKISLIFLFFLFFPCLLTASLALPAQWWQFFFFCYDYMTSRDLVGKWLICESRSKSVLHR